VTLLSSHYFTQTTEAYSVPTSRVTLAQNYILIDNREMVLDQLALPQKLGAGDTILSVSREAGMTSKQVLVILGIVAIIGLCACGVIAIVLFDSGNFLIERLVSNETGITPSQVSTSTRVTLPTSEPSTPSVDPTPSGESTPVPTQSIPIDSDVLAQMVDIEAQVTSLRGLGSTGPVERTLLTPDELYQYVLDDFFGDYTEEDAADDATVYSLFGLLESDFDLFNFYLDLYSEQVAGFYDDDVETMFVVQEAEFRGIERMTYAHEYVHALQDQTWDTEEGLKYNEEACEFDAERCVGIQSLLEGDAYLLEEQWLMEFATQTDINQFFEFYESYESPVYDSAPRFMQQDFLFSSTYGTDFVRQIHSQGGWEAVNEVYSDPPVSTEQILHPERYPLDKPIALDPPDLEPALGGAWREIEYEVLGEWFTQLILSEHVGDDLSILAAQGWGGDVYVALTNDDEGASALFLMTLWDSVRDAQEFAAAFLDYGDVRFGRRDVGSGNFTWESSEGSVLFERSGNQTLWILAPDADLVDSIRTSVEFPIGN
jgi:hypothetical protein